MGSPDEAERGGLKNEYVGWFGKNQIPDNSGSGLEQELMLRCSVQITLRCSLRREERGLFWGKDKQKVLIWPINASNFRCLWGLWGKDTLEFRSNVKAGSEDLIAMCTWAGCEVINVHQTAQFLSNGGKRAKDGAHQHRFPQTEEGIVKLHKEQCC